MDREVGRMSDETPLREHGAAPRPLPRWLVASIVTVLSAVAVLGWIYGPQQASDAAGSPDVLTAAGLCESGGPAGHDHSQQGPPAGTSPSPDACHQDGGGPEGSDFVNILTVSPNVTTRPTGPNASTGSFVSECGRNENNHRNPDNFITSPGVSNGAHHTHDYVGNVTTSAFSTNESLAAGDTTCRLGDRSAYFWPVLRRLDAVGADANAGGGGVDGNDGRILRPVSVQRDFLGNAQAKVVPMPRFIRAITGDAKAGTNGPTNARAQWTCRGFDNRVTTKYPICPGGGVRRVLEFPSCWNGKDTDSANHRSEEHTSELQSRENLVCRLLLEKKKNPLCCRRVSIHNFECTSPLH